jgi:8-oxo-dGTP pyrophosphatase MutT (NUDIX family)
MKKTMMNIRQSGVIPYRPTEDGVEILLITSSNGKQWIIPKGMIEFWLTPARSAAKEAWEEAGVIGRVITPSVGRYTAFKWGYVCLIEVFLMHVESELQYYPEMDQRQREWMSFDRAIARVKNEELKQLLITVKSQFE